MSIGIFFLVFAALLVIGTPICLVFSGMTIAPYLANHAFPYDITATVTSQLSGLDSFPLMAIPLFMLAGVIMAKGKISDRIFNMFAYFVGNKTAGLPCTVVLTCLFYGAISGSGPATTAAVGSKCIPFLVSVGYDIIFATALVAVAGGLGVIIPPSIPFIVYSSVAGTSVSKMFIAGVLPGCLIGLCLMIYCYIYCKIKGEDKEKLNARYQEIRAIGFWNLLKDSIWALLTPVIILGSIYGGIASPTEAATISIYYALFISLVVYKTLTIRELPHVVMEGVKTYAPILFVIASAVGFARVITRLNVATAVSQLIMGSLHSKVVVLLMFNAILLVVGMIMDTAPAVLVFCPVMLPVVKALEVDPVHFGIIMVVNLAIGFVTPPMGVNLFVASNLTKLPVMQIARRAVPFIVAFLIALLFITFIPAISLALV